MKSKNFTQSAEQSSGNSRIGAPNSVARFIAEHSWGENKFAVLERSKGELIVLAAQTTYLSAKSYWKPGRLLVDLEQCWIVDGRNNEEANQ